MEFNEEQKMIQETSRKFAIKEISPIATAEQEDSFPSQEIIKKIADIGLLGIMVPEEMGGAGSDMLSHVLALEEIAAADVGIAISYSNLCTLLNSMVAHGSEKIKDGSVPGVISGENLGAFCFLEAKAGSVPDEMETVVKPSNGGWALTGEKIFVVNGSIADFYVVFTTTGDTPKDGNSVGFFIVDKDQKGTFVEKVDNTMGIKSSSLADIRFDNARVPPENVLGKPGEVTGILTSFFDELKIGAAAISNGVARAALEGAIAYSKIRVQFGKPICDFPGIANRIADMDILLNASTRLTYWAAFLRDEKKKFRKEAAEAKVFGSETAYKVCHSGLQVYGGHGFIKEHPIEKYYRDQRILEIYAETNEINRNFIAGAVLGDR